LAALAICLSSALGQILPAHAGNDANFVLYNQHTAEKGEKEIKLYSDFSNAGLEDGYSAQLLELEYGVTDRWTSALYFEGVKIDGESYDFGGWRFENRVRVFDERVLLNPVLYIEYEQLEPEHRYKTAVTGRTDGEEEEEEETTEHELETRLILGEDLSKRLNVAFNWINEVDFDSGNWEFGYVAGLNYTLLSEEGEHESAGSKGCDLEELKLGVEFYGGLGDSEAGLTLDGSDTEQYVGINLKGELENGVEIGAGVALGLTEDSEDAIIRTMVGYEFK
jgi:hypothetical protein